MKKAIPAILFVALMLVSFVVFAQEPNHDPMARNLIFVEGVSELTVPVNGFSLTLDFDLEKASFNEAHQRAQGIIAAIQSMTSKLGLKEVEIIKGWDLVRQYKISFGSKGKKISNRLIIKVKNFPEGKLHDMLASMIDQSLAVDEAISLVDVNVFLTDELENMKKEEVVQEALKNLHSNAGKAAQAVQRTMSMPKRVFVTSEASVQEQEDSSRANYGYGSEVLAEQAFASRKIISVQKSFKVQSQVTDQIKMIAKVAGIYQID